MSTVINTRTLKTVKVTRTLEQAEAWAERLVPASDDYVVVGNEKKHFSCFTEEELDAIFTNITRRPNTGKTYSAKITKVMEALSKLEEDDTPVGSIGPRGGLPRQNSSRSISTPQGKAPWAETTKTEEEKTMATPSKKKTASKKTASKKTASKKTASKKTASKKTASKKTASKKATAKAADDRVRQNGVLQPKPGSKAGQVWDIADKLSAKLGEPAPRKDVLDAAIAKGLSPAGASADFQTWRKFHGLVKARS